MSLKKQSTPIVKMKAVKKTTAKNVGEAVGKKVQEIKMNTKLIASERDNNSILFRHLA